MRELGIDRKPGTRESRGFPFSPEESATTMADYREAVTGGCGTKLSKLDR